MTDQTLTISVRNLKALVEPVLPCASNDVWAAVLCGVHIKSHGHYLIATATDRYRAAMKRQAQESGDWPQWEAVIPTSALRSIFATFKPARGHDPEITLTVSGDRLAVETAGAMGDDLFSEARIAYTLPGGEFPKVANLFVQAIEREPAAVDQRLVWRYMSAFRAADTLGSGLVVRVGTDKNPTLVTDGEDFVAVVMPRRHAATLDLSSWTELLSPPPPPEVKKPARKKAATKKAGAAA